MDNIQINIDEQEKERLSKDQFNEIDNQIEEAVDKEIIKLKTVALKYLNELDKIKNEINQFKNLLSHQRAIRKNYKNNYNTIEEYIQGREQQYAFLHSDIPKRFYESTFNFQTALNNCLEQKIVMVYVYENTNGEPELYEILNEDILKFDVASRSNNFIARYQPTKNNLENSMKRLQIDSILNFNLPALKNTYKETLFRYRCSRKKNNRIVLWQNPLKTWHHVFISSEGDIAETYATIVLLNRKSPDFNNINMELNIEDFAKEVLNVDNMSGMLQGDVTVGNIEYGIKTLGASALSTNQLIKMAKTILKDAEFSKEKLLKEKQKLAKKAKTRNKIVDGLENTVTDSIQQIIDSFNSSNI